MKERLEEYRSLIQEIVAAPDYMGKAFVQSIQVALATVPNDREYRNKYIRGMGETFSVPANKVGRILELLP